ncbi:MAG: LysR family transcriptional regulator [Deltaproteobacteria bacterium]|nr:LysR family transcriptional regulator [Deltaproteobacteria bacterium]
MRGTVDLALVPAFVEVVRQGSFTKAAKALGLPKSTVSRHVTKLEEGLGAPLLVRTTRSLRLTEEGDVFYARVSTAIESVEEAARAVASQHEVPRGLLRISVPSDYDRMGPVLASFVARYPEVSVEVNVSGEQVDLVAEGYDLAIRAGRLADSSLIARKITTVEFQLFASLEYLAAHGEPRTVADLATHDCVLFKGRHGAARWTLEGPDGAEDVDVGGRVSVDDLVFVRAAVVAGLGVGFVPSGFFSEDQGVVRRVLPAYGRSFGAVYVVYPGSRHVPAKVRAFRDHVLESSTWSD